jgi:cytochrome c peroxidase
VALGRRLYFDPGLSDDRTIACATCDHPSKAFADGRAVSTGVGGQTGNPQLAHNPQCPYNGSQFWDGRAETLEEQAVSPVVNAVELAHTVEGMTARLAGNAPTGVSSIRRSDPIRSPATKPERPVRADARFGRFLL